MNAQLGAIEEELESATRRLRRLTAGLDEAVWQRRPAAGGWSAAECVAHLNLTTEATLPHLRGGVEELERRGSRGGGRMRRGVIGWLLWRSQQESARMRTSTRPSFVPSGDQAMEVAVARFEALQEELLALLRRGDGLALDGLRITSPFDARVRYNLFAAFSILSAHEHRHLAQAERAAKGQF
jgi:hypothetical protein